MVKIRFFTLIIASFIVQTACSEIIDFFDTRELTKITVTHLPSKTAYHVNEAFNPAGLVVTADYLDGSSGVITKYELSRPNMINAGIKPITVTFQKKTTSFDITVVAFFSTAITVFHQPVKTIYSVGERFDPTGLVVTASYSNGASGVIHDYTLSTPDMSIAGTKEITVTFEGKTASFNIQVAAAQGVTLNSIAVTQNPSKTVYYVNETFNSAGLVVTASYSDGLTGAITGYSLSTPVMSSTGEKTITVTYDDDKTASFTITVTEAPGVTLTRITVTQQPSKITCYVNEAFDPAGLEVTAFYSDDSSVVITDYTLSEPDMSGAGTKTIFVTFEGKTASFNIVVNVVTLSSITVSKIPAKTIYYVNDVFDPAELEVKAVYSNGSSTVITGYTLSTPDMSSAETKTITVTFQGKTASFNIVVNVVTLSSITVTTPPSKTAYHVNEAFDPAGLAVTAVYANGSSAAITTGYTLSTPDMSSAGTKTITVTYDGKTTGFNITVIPVSNDTGDIGIIIY
jgi:hypothetical protein